uniref:GTP-binding protein n=1 Tax=Crinalium epipsammum TaxID=241425 RepID=UPI0036F39B78
MPLPLIFDLGLNKIGLNRGYLDDNSLSLFSYQSDAAFDMKKFEVFLDKQLPTNVFWGKGILLFEQSPKCHGFLLSGKRFSLYHERWKQQPENRLILIGENLDNEWLSYRLNDCRSEV